MEPRYGSQDWLISKIGRYKAQLYRAVEIAVARHAALPPEALLDYTANAHASSLNSFVLAEAKKAFDGVKGSIFIGKNGTTYHQMSRCWIWYKQLGDDDEPSNYPTDTALSMEQGELPFPGEDSHFLVVLGFGLDATRQKLRTVRLLRRCANRHNNYYIEIEQVQATGSKIVAMPQATPEPKRARVVLRKGPEQKFLDELNENEKKSGS